MKSRIEALLALSVLIAAPVVAGPVEIIVTAAAETQPTEGDADDPAIWVNPADPAQSRILGTDKQIGLRVYDLSGALVQDFSDGALNNVDVRPFDGLPGVVALAGATKREDDTIVLYTIDAAGQVARTEPFAHPGIPESLKGQTDDIYGFALQRDPATGRVFALANFKSGHVAQWEITVADGRLSLRFARSWTVPSQPEGMLADDIGGMIYVGEEDGGIWRLAADPAAAPEAVRIDAIPSDCLPVDDVEGLAIHDDGTRRLLVASAQGIHRAAVYDLATGACLAHVGIAAGAVDGVTETDGLDVTAAPLPGFPQGLLVMMDDQNEGFTSNFKLVSWAEVAPLLPR